MIFVTVSYKGDLERLQLLRESMDVFYQGDSSHLIIVPDEDINLFRIFELSTSVKILKQNDFVDSFFYPKFWYKYAKSILGKKSWRLNKYAGSSGWIIQQIVKLSLPAVTDEEDIVVIDSDVVFTQKFSDSDFLPEYNKHFLVRFDPGEESARHRKHMKNSRNLLKLPMGNTEHHFMSCPVVLRRAWLLKLQAYIEDLYAKNWQKVLFEQDLISEYCIYGIFVEEVLLPNDLIIRTKPYNLGVWSSENFYQTLNKLLNTKIKNNDYICITIQSNLGISAKKYSASIKQFLKKSLI